MTTQKGFTLIEMLSTIALMMAFAVLTMGAFLRYRENSAVDKTVARVMSMIEKARAMTLGGKDKGVYSVSIHLDNAVLSSSLSSRPVEVFMYDPYILAANSLNQVGSSTVETITFNKVTGNAMATGTVQFYLAKRPASYKQITIYNTGLVEVNF
jgi:prepilin-type N-terminal cleavage/methylation domain-containing protein